MVRASLLAVCLISIIQLSFSKHIPDTLKNSQDEYFRDENNGDEIQSITADDLPKNDELFEGDIIMDDDIRNAVLAGASGKRSVVADAQLHGKKHWKDGIVPYVLDRSLAPIVRRRIYQAIRNFNKYTCIRFIPKRVKDEDYVRFKDGRGCSSYVGRKGGEQSIHLGYYCKRIGTVMHEMMHALGVIHEQSRSDRDKYVKIIFPNIKRKHLLNFQKYNYLTSSNQGIPYNYFSVMQYSNKAFSKNGRRTIISKIYSPLRFGQRKMVSHLDIKQINLLYKCLPIGVSTRRLYDDLTPRQALELKRRDQERDSTNE